MAGFWDAVTPDPIENGIKSLVALISAGGQNYANQEPDKARASSAKYGNRDINNNTRNNARRSSQQRNRDSNERGGGRDRPFQGSIAESGKDNWEIQASIDRRKEQAQQAAEEAQRQAFMREIMGRLDDPFSFSSEGVQSPELQAMLQNQLAELAAARQQTNAQYEQSDADLIAMHNAYQDEVRGQRPEIKEQNEDYLNDVQGIFQDTIQGARQGKKESSDNRAEMMKRLGLEQSAGANTETEEALTERIDTAEQSEDARLVEGRKRREYDLDDNRQFVNAIGNQEVERRSELEGILNEVLGGLSEKRAEYQGNYAEAMNQLRQTAEERAYQQWLEERQFDYGLLEQFDERMLGERELAQEMEMFQMEQAAEMAQAQREQSQQAQGLAGLLGQYGQSGDELVEAMIQSAGNPDVRYSDPASVLRAAQQNGSNVNGRQLLDLLTQYNGL